jgi:hypothetical protein
MKTGHESLNQTTFSKNEVYQHDPLAPDDSQSGQDGERWDQPNRAYNDLPDCGNDAENATPEMSSDDDDFAAILDLPPVKVKTELRKRIGIKVIMSRCEMGNTVAEIDMTKDAKDKPEEHEKVPIDIDKIFIKRLTNKENLD